LRARPTLELLLPGDPETLTGGYIYDRRIVEQLAARGWTIHVRSLEPSFPAPDRAALVHAGGVLDAIESSQLVVIDGLALGAMPDLIAKHAARLKLVALIHHPLAAETGLTMQQQTRLRQSERDALEHVLHVIVTSRWTRRALIDTGIDEARITVVEPGTSPAPLARGSGSSCANLLCVATLTPRKGHAVLFDALARVSDRSWRLDCVGSAARDPATTAALERQLDALGLSGRVRLRGETTAESLETCYDRADLFVLASFVEGYGMAHAEALAHGLPIVTTTAGALAETIPPTAAIHVAPGDPAALADALAQVLDDATLRAALARGAAAARATLPTWDDAGARFDAALEALR